MTTQQWLERGFNLNIEIQQLTDAKEKAKNLNRQAGGDLAGYKEYNRMLFKQIEKLLSISMEITRAISKLKNPVYRTMFTARYINFKSWEQIAEEMELDLRWVYRLKKRAMEEMEEVMKNSE